MSARSVRLLLLPLLLSLLALIQANHRAAKGRSALLKWTPSHAALEAGEPIYEVGEEGYPTLPATLLLMRPFLALGPRGGALLWALFKIVLAWGIVAGALRLASERAPPAPGRSPTREPLPAWAVLLVVLLSFRVLLSDVLHGNLNIPVGATVAAAGFDWARGRDLRAGVWIGLGAVLKVTPALALLFFLWKRSPRAVLGFGLGLALFAFVVPGLALGHERNLELTLAWSRQMLLPYLTGRELGEFQTLQTNQSLFAVLARLTTDVVAIPARPPVHPEDVRVHLVALGPAAFRALHLALSALVLLCVFRWTRGRSARSGRRALAEFSLLALAMLILSERSWKHHYVLLAWPLASLVQPIVAWRSGSRARRAGLRAGVAAAGIGASALLHGCTGSGLLGDAGSDLAEAYGAFLAGGVGLFVACGLSLDMSRDEGRDSPLEPAGIILSGSNLQSEVESTS